ncbi:exosome component 5-like protein [Zopfochytrium polystomum]|nr:exosome component 5-like protein [Zopfochytrium polystomum]
MAPVATAAPAISASAPTRTDGRSSALQIRPMQTGIGSLHRADGSARFSCGQTSVLAAVYGPKEVKIRDEKLDRATVEVILRPLIGSAGTRERLYERVIHSTMENAIVTASFPRTAIQIVLQVMSDDGSVLPVAMNAACLALVDAGVPLKSMVAAVECAYNAEGELMLDPNAQELESAVSTHVYAFDNINPHTTLCNLSTGAFKQQEFAKAFEMSQMAAAKVHEFNRKTLGLKIAHFEAAASGAVSTAAPAGASAGGKSKA